MKIQKLSLINDKIITYTHDQVCVRTHIFGKKREANRTHFKEMPFSKKKMLLKSSVF